MNENIPRWLFASIGNHFEDTLDSGTVVFIEGFRRRTSDVASFIEVRMDGPRILDSLGNETLFGIDVNVLVQCNTKIDSAHTYWSLIGQVGAAFEKSIIAYKYGSGVEDTDEQLVCLSRDQGIEIIHYGQLKPELTVQQGTVEARYKGAI